LPHATGSCAAMRVSALFHYEKKRENMFLKALQPGVAVALI